MRRYLNRGEAAEYLGYSRSYFNRIVQEYRIPSKGPSRNRFDVQDLEQFMDNPACFLDQEPTAAPRRTGQFTPLRL